MHGRHGRHAFDSAAAYIASSLTLLTTPNPFLQELEHLVGIDQDPSAHDIAAPRLREAAGPRLQLHQELGNFRFGLLTLPGAVSRAAVLAGVRRMASIHRSRTLQRPPWTSKRSAGKAG